MQSDVNIKTGRVTIECSVGELQEILAALAAVKGRAQPVMPSIWVYEVRSDSVPGQKYETRIWFEGGMRHGYCPCKDHTCRGGRWCKHLARSDRERLRQLATLS